MLLENGLKTTYKNINIMNFIEEKILEKGNLDKLKLRFPPEPNN
jgi:hypothetical protein